MYPLDEKLRKQEKTDHQWGIAIQLSSKGNAHTTVVLHENSKINNNFAKESILQSFENYLLINEGTENL